MIHIDQVIRTHRRTMAIILKADGTLVVRAPLHAPDALIRAFVESKAAWVARHRPAVKQTAAQALWFLGQIYPLRVEPNASTPLTFRQAFILSGRASGQAHSLLETWYRNQARRILTERVNHYATLHGFRFKGIRITSAQTRWGSCSANNGLNFPWRLVMAPLEAIDYVVVHELAHTREKNHGKGFWGLVRAILPDYARRKAWLNEHGGKLRLVQATPPT